MRFYVADEHIDHPKVLEHMPARGEMFRSLGEMRAEFIQRHNAVVEPCDEVYHLGDVAFHWQSHDDYISKLNGNHFLIKGNHERSRDIKKLLKQGKPYAWIKDVYMVKKSLIWLSHYPHLSWPQSHYGSIHLHGHSHGNLRQTFGKMLDVGLDGHDYYPWSEDEVCEQLANVEFVPTDHDRRRNDG